MRSTIKLLVFFGTFFLITGFVKGQDTVQVNNNLSLPQDQSPDSALNQDSLETFRNAFQKVLSQSKNQQENTTSTIGQDPVLELTGFILDETRSKLARDFYDLFYQNWEAPQDNSGFTITITERPSLGRGTQVIIQIDSEEVFNARLQPRYEFIEDLSKQAVFVCRQKIQENASIKQQLTGY